MTYDHIFVGLGSNLGDRLNFLTKTLQKIADLPDTRLLACSSIYQTEPIGFREQDSFLNLVIELSTNFDPVDFLHQIQKIEGELGRLREMRWGPRTIDIDILYWGEAQISTTQLRIPHPEAANRKFVLAPLHEIAPDFKAPPGFQTISKMLANVADTGRVEMYLPKEKVAALIEKEDFGAPAIHCN